MRAQILLFARLVLVKLNRSGGFGRGLQFGFGSDRALGLQRVVVGRKMTLLAWSTSTLDSHFC